MKFCVALISLVLCLSYVVANEDCPTFCTFDYNPVCGEATVGGQLVRCQFSNACTMKTSACTRSIDWRQTNCGNTSPNCESLV